jgi:hypothetical protein
MVGLSACWDGDAEMTKTIDEYFVDWEGDAFGFGYGTGEEFTIPALLQFFSICSDEKHRSYDHEILARKMGGTAAWLMINALCKADIIEYGTSPRAGWLSTEGKRLREYVIGKPCDDLIGLVCNKTEDYTPCYPSVCNCGSKSRSGNYCPNPFWPRRITA